MNDITMLAIGAAFAVSTWLLIVLSDRLMGSER
jgi:hypothetical protein